MRTLLALLFFVVAANAAGCVYQTPVACRTITRYQCQIRVPVYNCQTVRYYVFYPAPACYSYKIIYNSRCFSLCGYQISYPEKECGPEKDISTVVEEARAVVSAVYEDEMKLQQERCDEWEKRVEATQSAHYEEYEEYLAKHKEYLVSNMRTRLESEHGSPLPADQEALVSTYQSELQDKHDDLLSEYKSQMDTRFDDAKKQHDASLEAYGEKLKAYGEKIIASYETCLKSRIEAIEKYEKYLKEEYVVSKVEQYKAYLERVKATRVAIYTKTLLGFQVCDKYVLTEKNKELVEHYGTLLDRENESKVAEYEAKCMETTKQLLERYRCSYTCSIGRCGYSYNRQCYQTYWRSCSGFWRYQTCQVLKPTRCCRFTEINIKVGVCGNLRKCDADVPIEDALEKEKEKMDKLISEEVEKVTNAHTVWLEKWTKQHEEYVTKFDEIVAERHEYALLAKKHYLEMTNIPEAERTALLEACRKELDEKRTTAVEAFKKQLQDRLDAATTECTRRIQLYKEQLEKTRDALLAKLNTCYEMRLERIEEYEKALEEKHAKMVEAYYEKLRDRSEKIKKCYFDTLEDHHPEGDDGLQCDKILLRKANTAYYFKLKKHDDAQKEKYEKQLEELRAQLVEHYRCSSKCSLGCFRFQKFCYRLPCWRIVYPCAASYSYCYRSYCQRTTYVWYRRSCGCAYRYARC